MFDPDLWKRTKASAISLVVLGGVLLLPAGYVFTLTSQILMQGSGLGILGGAAALFWTALIGSSVGVLAWISLCLLLFQRRDIRIHRLAWHLVRLSGMVIAPCLGVWFYLTATGSRYYLSSGDTLILRAVLSTILAAALLFIWLGHRNLGWARSAAWRAAGAKIPGF